MRVPQNPIQSVFGRKTRMGTCVVATLGSGEGPRARHLVTPPAW